MVPHLAHCTHTTPALIGFPKRARFTAKGLHARRPLPGSPGAHMILSFSSSGRTEMSLSHNGLPWPLDWKKTSIPPPPPSLPTLQFCFLSLSYHCLKWSYVFTYLLSTCLTTCLTSTILYDGRDLAFFVQHCRPNISNRDSNIGWMTKWLDHLGQGH